MNEKDRERVHAMVDAFMDERLEIKTVGGDWISSESVDVRLDYMTANLDDYRIAPETIEVLFYRHTSGYINGYEVSEARPMNPQKKDDLDWEYLGSTTISLEELSNG